MKMRRMGNWMNKKSGTLQYKCRRRGVIFDVAHAHDLVAALVSIETNGHIEHMVTGTAMHTCAGSRIGVKDMVGIADLIGGRFDQT